MVTQGLYGVAGVHRQRTSICGNPLPKGPVCKEWLKTGLDETQESQSHHGSYKRLRFHKPPGHHPTIRSFGQLACQRATFCS